MDNPAADNRSAAGNLVAVADSRAAGNLVVVAAGNPAADTLAVAAGNLLAAVAERPVVAEELFERAAVAAEVQAPVRSCHRSSKLRPCPWRP